MCIGDGGIAELQIGEADVDVVVRRRAEAVGILRVGRPGAGDVVGQTQLGRDRAVGDADRGGVAAGLAVAGVVVRAEAVVVVTHRRNQGQALADGDLVLHISTALQGQAHREVARREGIRRDLLGADAGELVGLQAVAHFAGAAGLEVQAIGQQVMSGAGGEAAAQGAVEADHVLLETEITLDQQGRGRAADGLIPRFHRGLPGQAVAAVEPQHGAVVPAAVAQLGLAAQAQRTLRVVTVLGLGVDDVEAGRRADGSAEIAAADAAQHIGVAAALGAAEDQAVSRVLAIEHALGQKVVVVVILRIGLGAGLVPLADVATVVQLLTVAPVEQQHPGISLAAEGAEHGFRRAVVDAVAPRLAQRLPGLAGIEIILRVLGGEADHAADGIRAVQG